MNVLGSDIEKDIWEYLNLDISLVVLYIEFFVVDVWFVVVVFFIVGVCLLW